jgi:hypothetical protein
LSVSEQNNWQQKQDNHRTKGGEEADHEISRACEIIGRYVPDVINTNWQEQEQDRGESY